MRMGAMGNMCAAAPRVRAAAIAASSSAIGGAWAALMVGRRAARKGTERGRPGLGRVLGATLFYLFYFSLFYYISFY